MRGWLARRRSPQPLQPPQQPQQPQPPQSPQPPPVLESPSSRYETLYDAYARSEASDAAIGGGPFELFGRLELAALVQEGLKPTDTLVDFGCGIGRLAAHAIPYLAGGQYIGTDISAEMLARAERRLGDPSLHRCRVTWVHQRTDAFPLEGASVDMITAFSVFTHMEHEDTYRYLRDARRVVRPGGRFVLSCLSMDLPAAREIFLDAASMDWPARWNTIRNVTTSRELMEAVATLAGWRPAGWYAGNEASIPLDGGLHCLGQSICVLERPSEASAAHEPEGR